MRIVLTSQASDIRSTFLVDQSSVESFGKDGLRLWVLAIGRDVNSIGAVSDPFGVLDGAVRDSDSVPDGE